MFKNVLLPHPDGPTMLTNSPLPTSRLKLLSAVTGSRVLDLKTKVMFRA